MPVPLRSDVGDVVELLVWSWRSHMLRFQGISNQDVCFGFDFCLQGGRQRYFLLLCWLNLPCFSLNHSRHSIEFSRLPFRNLDPVVAIPDSIRPNKRQIESGHETP